MGFTRFMELPPRLKIDIIRKCLPISYVNLRRTCRFVDEFCEQNPKWIGVYCKNRYLFVAYEKEKRCHCVCINENVELGQRRRNFVTILLTRENIPRISKTLSGFKFAYITLNCILNHTNAPTQNSYTEALDFFLEAVPHLKVKKAHFVGLQVEHINRVMESKWKIERLRICASLGREKIANILTIDAIKRRDNIHYIWERNGRICSERDIVELVRGKQNIKIEHRCLSKPSSLIVLKAIAENWQNDNRYPKKFFMLCNLDEESFMSGTIPGCNSYLMNIEALHIGCFPIPMRFKSQLWSGSNEIGRTHDIWIKKEGTNWHLATLKKEERRDRLAGFTYETAGTVADFLKIIMKFLQYTYRDNIFDGSTIYEAAETNNLENIREAFDHIIPLRERTSQERAVIRFFSLIS